MDIPLLLLKTIVLRPYVFVFLGAFLFAAQRLLGWRRTGFLFAISWITAFVCEYASTRIGIPFGSYFYTGSTVGEELYISNIPFMDSLSFTFLLYASYCLALLFLLPAVPQPPLRLPAFTFDRGVRTSPALLVLTALLYAFIDVVIDPVALRGDRWFLGKIYGYPDPGIYFGVPLVNFLGWGIVGLLSLTGYVVADRRLPSHQFERQPSPTVTVNLLLGAGLYYGVLVFNLVMTFSIGEALLGITGLFIHLPILILAALRMFGYPAVARSQPWR